MLSPATSINPSMPAPPEPILCAVPRCPTPNPTGCRSPSRRCSSTPVGPVFYSTNATSGSCRGAGFSGGRHPRAALAGGVRGEMGLEPVVEGLVDARAFQPVPGKEVFILVYRCRLAAPGAVV